MAQSSANPNGQTVFGRPGRIARTFCVLRSFHVWMLALRSCLVVVLTAGCGRGAVLPPVVADPPPPMAGPTAPMDLAPYGVPGEKMTYDIRFRGVSVGRLRIAVGQPHEVDGRDAIRVRSQVDSTGLLAIIKDVSWELETLLDLKRGYPISTISNWKATVDGRAQDTRVERAWHKGDHTHNLHSAIGVLRAWDPAPGARARMVIDIGGTFAMELGPVTRTFSRRFQVAALRIAGTTDLGRRYGFVLWMSDDARRLPLRIEMTTRWGKATVSLIYYDGPGRDGDVHRRVRTPI